MVGIPPNAPQPLGWPANSLAWVTRHRNICLTFNPPSSPFPLSGPVSRVASRVGLRESATPGPQVRTFPPQPQGHPAPFSLPGQQPPAPGAAAAPTLCTALGLVPRWLRGLLGELLSPPGLPARRHPCPAEAHHYYLRSGCIPATTGSLICQDSERVRPRGGRTHLARGRGSQRPPEEGHVAVCAVK